MIKKRSLISPKYRDIALLTKEIPSIKKETPWPYFVLDDFIEYKAFKRMQKTLLSKKHKFSILEGDVNYVQFALLKYLPFAKIFYSLEFKNMIETLGKTSVSINTNCYVQLRYMNQESPEFGIHVDDVGVRSLIVIYYISPDWTEESGGQLCLYKNEADEGNPAVIVNPIENRLICFFSDNTNWHSIKKINTSWERYSILSEWVVKDKKQD